VRPLPKNVPLDPMPMVVCFIADSSGRTCYNPGAYRRSNLHNRSFSPVSSGLQIVPILGCAYNSTARGTGHSPGRQAGPGPARFVYNVGTRMPRCTRVPGICPSDHGICAHE